MDWLTPRPGRPTDHNDGDYLPDDPDTRADACDLVNDDDNMCYENCMLREMTAPRPPFAIGPRGTDCGEWTDQAHDKCSKECRAREESEENYLRRYRYIHRDFSHRVY